METTNTIEQELSLSAELAISEAKSLTIANNSDYQAASRLLIEHKQRIKAVKEYWDKPKSMAKKAHQEICDKEKAMLAPFTEAEAIIKGSIVVYQRKLDEERRAAEEEARRLKQEEAERLMAEAIKAEETGDMTRSNVMMAKATTLDEAPVPVQAAAPKAAGISTKKTWKARILNESIVPAYVGTAMIRPIDLSALNQIARETKGSYNIPGVEFYEDVTISARA